jgi:hypothetical protein
MSQALSRRVFFALARKFSWSLSERVRRDVGGGLACEFRVKTPPKKKENLWTKGC